MKKAALIVAVFSTVALLCLLASPSPVRANPDRILEPSFETVGNWSPGSTDADYAYGQSGTWKTQGLNSYLFSSTETITTDTYVQISQSVDFAPIDTISFDAYLWGERAGDFKASVYVGAAEVWTQACPDIATEYLHQEVDVSGYSGSQSLIFRVTCLKLPTTSKNQSNYFDNIKIWGSYSGSGRTTVSNNFTTYGVSVYMYGENFDISPTYKVGYYDGGTAHDGADGTLLVADSDTTLDGIFNAFVIRPADYGASSYGLWHAVVYKTTGDMPNSYDLVSTGDAAYTITDSFTVDVECIPEFPTVFAAIGVGGLCSGIYWWMRRRAKLRAYRPPPYRQ